MPFYSALPCSRSKGHWRLYNGFRKRNSGGPSVEEYPGSCGYPIGPPPARSKRIRRSLFSSTTCTNICSNAPDIPIPVGTSSLESAGSGLTSDLLSSKASANSCRSVTYFSVLKPRAPSMGPTEPPSRDDDPRTSSGEGHEPIPPAFVALTPFVSGGF